MDAAALAGLCALLARGMSAQPLPAGVNCPAAMATSPSISAAAAPPSGSTSLAARLGGPEAREAIARVAFAEAANQGDSGLAAVVYTIMNRLQWVWRWRRAKKVKTGTPWPSSATAP